MNVRPNAPTFQSRDLSSDVAGKPATLQSVVDLADAMTPALQRVEATIVSQQRRIEELESGFERFLDDVIEGLERDPIMQSGASPINVSVVNGGEQYQPAPESYMAADLDAKMDRVIETLMMPTVPMFQNGKLVGAKRVPPEQLGGSNNAK